MTASPPRMTRAQAAAILGVPVAADAAEVQHAFLRLARHVHPDTLLPEADDGQRRAAAARFDELSRARAALLTAPVEPPATVPEWRPAPGRGLGGSLVVLVLLAFLLVALVTIDEAFRSHAFAPPPQGPSISSTP